MLMLIHLWQVVSLWKKWYGAMIKELNLESKGERFKFPHFQPKYYLSS
jgi:hypothetical protein